MSKFTPNSFGDRLDRAFKEIRSQGVVARRNVPGCCRGCAGGEFKLADDQPIIWHFGGQGNRLMFIDDGVFEYTYEAGSYSFRTGKRFSGMSWPGKEFDGFYLNHDNLTNAEGLTAAGQAVVDVFKKYDIAIDWDQTGSKCIYVKTAPASLEQFTYESDQTLAFI